MEELKRRMDKCCELSKKLYEEIDNAREQDRIDVAYKCADMLANVASAEKDIAEACYYKCIVKAMHEDEEVNKTLEKLGREGMLGYNSNRYADGRYAPSGHGNYSRGGFHPSGHEFGMDMMPPYMMGEDYRMGYSDSSNGRSNSSSQSGSRMGHHGQLEGMMDEIGYEVSNINSPEEKRRIKEKMQHIMTQLQ